MIPKCKVLLTLERQEAWQKDLDRLEHWAIIKGMKINEF